jgi:hypothetical protein
MVDPVYGIPRNFIFAADVLSVKAATNELRLQRLKPPPAAAGVVLRCLRRMNHVDYIPAE